MDELIRIIEAGLYRKIRSDQISGRNSRLRSAVRFDKFSAIVAYGILNRGFALWRPLLVSVLGTRAHSGIKSVTCPHIEQQLIGNLKFIPNEQGSFQSLFTIYGNRFYVGSTSFGFNASRVYRIIFSGQTIIKCMGIVQTGTQSI